MLFSDSFYTIQQPSQAVYKDRGSKFIAHAYPVKTEAEIKQIISQLKKEHPSANHYCYAWRLGPDKLAFRINDDGEPSGSAGKPIYSQIQSKELSNICIVVVRYFGGTLLGVPGLINAYKNAAAGAIQAAGVTEQFITFEYSLEFSMEDTSQVMRLLKEVDAKIISNNYGEKNILVFQSKKQYAQQLELRLKELYRTKLTFLKLI